MQGSHPGLRGEGTGAGFCWNSRVSRVLVKRSDDDGGRSRGVWPCLGVGSPEM